MSYRGIFRLGPAVGLAAILIGSAPAVGANFLKDISVKKTGDTVVVVISTFQPCEFDTLSVAGKQERIVIDLSGVTNVWSQKKFADLPFKSIQSIRTSQFQKDPLVTRVVLDIDRPIQFTSDQKENDILIRFPVIAGETDFAEWRAQGTASVAVAPVQDTSSAAPEAVKPDEKEAATPQPEVGKPIDTKLTSTGVKIEAYPKRKLVSYDTPGHRDPFMPLVGSVPGQLYNELPVIENLKLVGILEDIDGNRALLEDAEGNGYILQTNDKVKNGYLVSVTESKAIFQITEYGWTRTVALELNLPELR